MQGLFDKKKNIYINGSKQFILNFFFTFKKTYWVKPSLKYTPGLSVFEKKKREIKFYLTSSVSTAKSSPVAQAIDLAFWANFLGLTDYSAPLFISFPMQ